MDSVFFGDVVFYGKVVDMLYFPLTGESYFLPDWIPFWGGDHFIFFRPIFNIGFWYLCRNSIFNTFLQILF